METVGALKRSQKRLLSIVLACGAYSLHAHATSACHLALQNVFAENLQPNGQSMVVDAQSSHVDKQRLPEEAIPTIEKYGPYQQPMAAQVFPDGTTGAFGTAKGIQMVRNDVVSLSHAVHTLTGTTKKRVFEFNIEGTPVRIETASSLVGSARLKRLFSDIDAELTMVVQYEGFHESHFHDPNSIFAKAVEKFMLQYVEEGESTGMIFSEAKCGSLDHVSIEAESTQSKAIKWSKDQLYRGVQEVYSDKKNDLFDTTLREGITGHSRIKFDWFTRVGVPPEYQAKFGGLQTRLVEGSVMINLAARNGENSPVPFVSQIDDFPSEGATGGHISVEGFGDNRPLKLTAVSFSPEEANLLQSVTASAAFTPVDMLSIAVVNSSRTYREQFKTFKALRNLFTRLNYGNDVEEYRIAMQRAGMENIPTAREITASFRAFVDDPTFNELSVLLSSAKDLLNIQKVIKARHLDIDVSADAKSLLHALNQYASILGVTSFAGIDEFGVNFIQTKLDALITQKLESYPGLNSYLDYVMRAPKTYEKPFRSDEKIFVSFTPSESFLAKYDQRLERWKQQYPNLVFENRFDLHMTLAFMGDLTPEQRVKAKGAIDEFAHTVSSLDLDFKRASFQKVGRGRNDAIIALHFDPEQVDPRMKAAVLKLKQEMVLIGVKPDRHLDSFVPHITLCTLPPQLQGKVEHAELAKFLANETPGDLAVDAVTHELRVLYRAVEEPNPAEPVYRLLQLGEQP